MGDRFLLTLTGGSGNDSLLNTVSEKLLSTGSSSMSLLRTPLPVDDDVDGNDDDDDDDGAPLLAAKCGSQSALPWTASLPLPLPLPLRRIWGCTHLKTTCKSPILGT